MSYEKIVLVVFVFSVVVVFFGVGIIIKIVFFILSIVYLLLIVLIILVFFNEKIKNDNVYKGVVYMLLFVSILIVIFSYGVVVLVVNFLFFNLLGFNWVVLVIIVGIIGNFILLKS